MTANFPGRIVKEGEADNALVGKIQGALKERGYGPFRTPGFDAAMTSIVKLFQSQHVDADGHALIVDGEIGRLTWGALFGLPPVVPASAPSVLMLQALGIAGSQVGQMEVPPGSNRGPMVDAYLRSADIDPTRGSVDARAWCMAFVYLAFKTAADSLGVVNPLPRTAGCLDHWNLAAGRPGVKRIPAQAAAADPTLLRPGVIAILDFGSGHGHTGVVERVMPGGRLMTVEGNTNNSGSRSGVGVFRLDRRKLTDATLKGFVDYTDA